MADSVPPSRSSELSRLLSLTSHELRTPISIVAGYLRMLQKDRDRFEAPHRKMIDEAEKACAKMVALIGEISTVGKLEASEGALPREPVDLAPLLEEVATQAEPGHSGATTAFNGAGRELPVRGDRTQLKAAFDAFVRAVLREQIDPVTIVVSASCPDASIVRVVIARDDEAPALAGRPAAPFDEFRGGIGLVLPIARRVIERHGGRVWSPANEDGVAAPRSGIVVELPAAAAQL